MKHRAWIAIIFVIGCATGGVASQLVVVPQVRAGTTPTRWEYLCEEVESGGLTTELNKVGAQGWELASVAPHQHATSLPLIYCAKRALP